MRIYKMTATFGKLEHETLELEPGLNVIEAPNEWGKTTWCSFLITMLYGLDTRAKTTKTALADKEKYAPWSGSPMAGRIDLRWKGRDITIERSTKGRSPLGVFRAYETQSGLAVPELTAANCGQLLLGVEQSVFRRTGFIRQSDLPVTQDDALRRRLNALVTTGDESGDSDRLAEELKNLKNKCRYNRSGLLPQAEAQRRELEERLGELETLRSHSRHLRERLGEVKSWRQSLENHADALLYAQAEADAGRVAEARNLRDQAQQRMTELERRCAGQPDRGEIAETIGLLQDYRREAEACRTEEMAVANAPAAPIPPELFRGMSLEQAEEMVGSDMGRYALLRRTKPYFALLIPGAAFLLFGIWALIQQEWMGAVVLLPAVLLLALGLRKKTGWSRERQELEEKYGSGDPDRWQGRLETYRAERKAYEQAMEEYRLARKALDSRGMRLKQRREQLLGSQSPEQALEACLRMEKNWEHYALACRELQQAEKHLEMLQEMAQKTVKKPAMADTLAYSEQQTQALLAEAQAEQQRLQNRLGQYQGRMEALGDADDLQAQLQQVETRIGRLEETYAAVTLALDTLSQARQELQRRFAPRIADRAREWMKQMTGGRYDRLTFNEDLSLLAGAAEEETLRETLWRSDGTMDQLYLALRLAVAEELTPEAPLVLDDAFVRFDDTRLAAALEILKQAGKKKQVILFTCQHRETELLH